MEIKIKDKNTIKIIKGPSLIMRIEVRDDGIWIEQPRQTFVEFVNNEEN